MKTKIIYISGSEVFDMTEIRAAFDEVRGALGLDNNTILFGVPVDCDNALETIGTIEQPVKSSVAHDFTPCEQAGTDINASNVVLEINDVVAPSVPQSENINSVPDMDDNSVIPILSVLSVNDDDNIETTGGQNTQGFDRIETDIVIDDIPDAQNPVIEDNDIATQEGAIKETMSTTVSIDSDVVLPTSDDNTGTTTVSIADMITDEVPEEPVEKTLEHLLESMTPLREDVETGAINLNTDDADEDSFYDIADSDTDATLAQLASEFVQTEDSIETVTKNETHGKIGKLKNILPFKKAKRDDGGLMGDLFGWAGIAANDDDFSIPGFFSKKQGA